MRKPWVLDVTLRGDPYALRDSVNRIPRAPCRRQQLGQRQPGVAADSLRRRPSSTMPRSTPGVRGGEAQDAVAQARSRPSARRCPRRTARRWRRPRCRSRSGRCRTARGGSATVWCRAALAAICTCAVEVPSPNSTVPTAISYMPSSRSVAHASEMCSVGGAVSCMRTRGAGADEPVVAEGVPVGRCAAERRRPGRCTAPRPSSAERHIVGLVADGQQGVAGPDDVAAP